MWQGGRADCIKEMPDWHVGTIDFAFAGLDTISESCIRGAGSVSQACWHVFVGSFTEQKFIDFWKKLLPVAPEEGECSRLFRVFDQNNNNSVSIPEFVDAIEIILNSDNGGVPPHPPPRPQPQRPGVCFAGGPCMTREHRRKTAWGISHKRALLQRRQATDWSVLTTCGTGSATRRTNMPMATKPVPVPHAHVSILCGKRVVGPTIPRDRSATITSVPCGRGQGRGEGIPTHSLRVWSAGRVAPGASLRDCRSLKSHTLANGSRTECSTHLHTSVWVKPFFSGAHTLPQGGGACLPFWKG